MATESIESVLERVARLDREATKGPWETDGHYDLYVYVKPRGNGTAVADRNVEHDDEAPEESLVRARGVGAGLTEATQAANMRLVAAYRTDAPLLAAEVRRLRSVIETAHGVIQHMRACRECGDESDPCDRIVMDVEVINREVSRG